MTRKGQVDVILLGLAKAFDKVPHHRLLHKLNYYGVQDSTLRWIESFEPKEAVCFIGWHQVYTEAFVLSCVLQCTVLGPLLLLTFINDPPEPTKHSDARLLADDCLLYRHITLNQDQALSRKTYLHWRDGKKPGK